MSQVVGSSIDGQFTETKPSAFGNFIKSNPKLINDLISGGFPLQQKPAFQQNNGEPYVFLKDFSFINSTTDGSIGSNMVNYKKDQVVYPFPSSPNVRMMPNPAFTKAINEKVLVPQKMSQQKVMSNTQKNNTKEPIYYILVTAGVIIAGYFVYKKFKK